MSYFFSGILLGLIVVLFWALPPRLAHRRVDLVIAFSALCLIYLSFQSFVLYILFLGMAYLGALALERSNSRGFRRLLINAAIALLLLAMLGHDLIVGFQQQRFGNPVLYLVGFSYSLIRIYAFLDVVYHRKEPVSARSFFAYTLFFPTFLSGPIEAYDKFHCKAFAGEFLSEYLYTFVIRTSIGLFLVYYLGEAVVIRQIGQLNEGDTYWVGETLGGVDVYLFFILKFLYLYLNFAGFTSISIGVAALFGYRAFENFRWPLLAPTPVAFWSRWHMSLGRFVMKHVYFRIAMFTRRPMLSIFLSFVGIGLWHHIELGYFLWGAAHGLAIVAFTMLQRRYGRRVKALSAPVRFGLRSVGCVFTVSWIATISAMANAPSVEAFGNALFRMIVG